MKIKTANLILVVKNKKTCLQLFLDPTHLNVLCPFLRSQLARNQNCTLNKLGSLSNFVQACTNREGNIDISVAWNLPVSNKSLRHRSFPAHLIKSFIHKNSLWFHYENSIAFTNCIKYHNFTYFYRCGNVVETHSFRWVKFWYWHIWFLSFYWNNLHFLYRFL